MRSHREIERNDRSPEAPNLAAPGIGPEIELQGRGGGRFFREYGRWIRHYALMAEKQVELLAIGPSFRT
jgi:hypothetical protein